MKYVLGFAFDEDHVLLIRKQRPEWQCGKLNGVGGKIEEGEVPLDAMYREFNEETGMKILDWVPVCIMSGPNWEVNVFACDVPMHWACQMTDEEPVVVNRTQLPPDIIPNLKWLIPLARDILYREEIREVLVKYKR